MPALAIPDAPAEIFSDPQGAVFLASALSGQALFKEACLTCHGEGGTGKGPQSEGLVDAEGDPIVPRDLSRAYIKSGRSARDVYKAIATGLDGTPMPAFAEIYPPEKIWKLVSYVFFLRAQGNGDFPREEELNSNLVARYTAERDAKKALEQKEKGPEEEESWD